METIEKQQEQHGHKDKDVTLEVQTTRGTRTFTFPRNTKVQEVIDTVVKAFGFNTGDTFQLVLASAPDKPLDPNRPLVSYHLEDGTKVILTATGTGV